MEAAPSVRPRHPAPEATRLRAAIPHRPSRLRPERLRAPPARVRGPSGTVPRLAESALDSRQRNSLLLQANVQEENVMRSESKWFPRHRGIVTVRPTRFHNPALG